VVAVVQVKQVMGQRMAMLKVVMVQILTLRGQQQHRQGLVVIMLVVVVVVKVREVKTLLAMVV
jgi:hypothetical protein